MPDNHLHEHKGPTVNGIKTWLYWWSIPSSGDIRVEAHAGHVTQHSIMLREAASPAAFDAMLTTLAKEVNDA